jgi:hypothetical protein
VNTVVDAVKQELAASVTVKLNLGSGKVKMDGYLNVDRRQFDGVDGVTDLSHPGRWRFDKDTLGPLALKAHHGGKIGEACFTLPSNSVSEAHCSHFLEHLTGPQRVQFMNELYRVLVPDGKCTIITPYWCSSRAYGDFTHQWPPVGEMFYFYLNKAWRAANAPDNDIEWNPDGYACDFDWTYGYGLNQQIMSRNQEYQTFALSWYKEAAQDLHATVTAARKKT